MSDRHPLAGQTCAECGYLISDEGRCFGPAHNRKEIVVIDNDSLRTRLRDGTPSAWPLIERAMRGVPDTANVRLVLVVERLP